MTPTLIITDPREVTRRCLNQRPVSRDEAVRSVLKQNEKPVAIGALYLAKMASGILPT